MRLIEYILPSGTSFIGGLCAQSRVDSSADNTRLCDRPGLGSSPYFLAGSLGGLHVHWPCSLPWLWYRGATQPDSQGWIICTVVTHLPAYRTAIKATGGVLRSQQHSIFVQYSLNC